ncbi:unnamed protein product [Ectocarpus sp. 13 AM-2016]
MLSEAVVGDDEPREGANQDFTSTTGGLGVASSFACAGVESSLHLFGGVFVGKAAEAYWTTILQLRRGDGSCFEDSQTRAARGDARRADGAIRGLKRKRAGAVAPSDATPRAPEGRAAAQAKAAGQGCTTFVSECSLPTEKGNFRLRAYRYADGVKTHEPVVMVAGQVRGRENVPVRVHDQCQTSEVLGSKRCDCREQLDLSLRYIQEHGGGAVIYLAQEGRGIGLANKVAAYALQDDGLDTVEANRQLGFGDDERSYECVEFILADMEIKSVQLMTNNPFKIDWLRATGVKVEGRIPIEVPANEHNHGYLETKASRMSHLINSL